MNLHMTPSMCPCLVSLWVYTSLGLGSPCLWFCIYPTPPFIFTSFCQCFCIIFLMLLCLKLLCASVPLFLSPLIFFSRFPWLCSCFYGSVCQGVSLYLFLFSSCSVLGMLLIWLTTSVSLSLFVSGVWIHVFLFLTHYLCVLGSDSLSPSIHLWPWLPFCVSLFLDNPGVSWFCVFAHLLMFCVSVSLCLGFFIPILILPEVCLCFCPYV